MLLTPLYLFISILIPFLSGVVATGRGSAIHYTVRVPAPTEDDQKQMKSARIARLWAAHKCHENSALVRAHLEDEDLSGILQQSAQDNGKRAQDHTDLATQAAQPDRAHVYHLLRDGWFKKDAQSAGLQIKLLDSAHRHLMPSGGNQLPVEDRIKKAREEYAHAVDHGPNGHCHRENCEGKIPRIVITHH